MPKGGNSPPPRSAGSSAWGSEPDGKGFRPGWQRQPGLNFYSHFKNPLMICSSASCSVRPRVISLVSCSPAILPMAASCTRAASTSLASSGAGPRAVEPHVVGAQGPLVTVGHQSLPHHQPGSGGQLGDGLAVGVVHALDLGHLHLHDAVFFHVNLGAGVQNALALPVAGAVVLLDVLHLCVFAHPEAVDAVVLGIRLAAVVDAAAGDDDHVAVLADEEVVVDHLA